MTRIEACAAILTTALLIAACDRFAAREEPTATAKSTASASVAQGPSGASVSPGAVVPSGQIDALPADEPASRIVERKDVEVGGKPACALTVRYAGSVDQPATWRGEGCAVLTVRFTSLGDLSAIGQAAKLDAEARTALGELPGGKVLYIEGAHASAIFVPNEAGLLVRTDLAD